jgi:hypothetical protein
MFTCFLLAAGAGIGTLRWLLILVRSSRHVMFDHLFCLMFLRFGQRHKNAWLDAYVCGSKHVFVLHACVGERILVAWGA